jgi:large subunit ribosomal protein L4
MAESTVAKLNKEVFSLEVSNHELLGRAYRAYLANSRSAQAVVKKRGEVRGGGRKPWQQKGTGRARIGSIRAPHWRGGGVTFGPNGNENYTISIPKSAKKVAIRQALSLQNKDGIVKVIEAPKFKDGKTKEAVEFLKKQKADSLKHVLVVVESKDEKIVQASSNLQNLKIVASTYLNVFDILNADLILISKGCLSAIEEWLLSTAAKEGAKKAELKISTIKSGEDKIPTKTNKRKISVEELRARAPKSNAKSSVNGGAK